MNQVGWLPGLVDSLAPPLATRPRNGRYLDLDADKLRGGYYTPGTVAEWLCSWAVRARTDRVLEPSCGDGAFLVSAVDRLRALGAGDSAVDQVQGVEVLEAAGLRARERLSASPGSGAERAVIIDDFFHWWSTRRQGGFHCVVGNPPFIRYQTFPEPARSRAMAIMEQMGLRPNRLTNIWVPFVVGAAACLAAGGRMALVLPAELLQVSYAAGLRSFLAERFASIDIVTCNELFFPGAEQEVVLLLADGAIGKPSGDNTCRIALHEAATIDEITRREPRCLVDTAEHKDIRHDQEKWLKYFLSGREIGLMRALRAHPGVATLSAHASVDVGIVTGKNDFFVLTEEQASEHGISDHVVPLVSRAAHLRGAKITRQEWAALSSAGERVHLLNLNALATRPLRGPVARYVRAGESEGVHTGYKCSIRSPWFTLPAVWTPDAFVFRQIYDFPRIVRNRAGASSTDTIHRLSCPNVDPDVLTAISYTHMTAASAEIEGRSYGGGVLELEPTEAERLLVPAALRAAVPLAECDRLIRVGRLDDLLQENDRALLHGQLGLPAADCGLLQAVWQKMRDRRRSRTRRRPASANRPKPGAG